MPVVTAHIREQVARSLRLFAAAFLASLSGSAALAKGLPLTRGALVGLVAGAATTAVEVTWRQLKPTLPVSATQALAAVRPLADSPTVLATLERIAKAVESASPVAGELLTAVAPAPQPPVVVHVHPAPPQTVTAPLMGVPTPAADPAPAGEPLPPTPTPLADVGQIAPVDAAPAAPPAAAVPVVVLPTAAPTP